MGVGQYYDTPEEKELAKVEIKLNAVIEVIRKIRKSYCGGWLAPHNFSKRGELMKLIDELYMTAGVSPSPPTKNKPTMSATTSANAVHNLRQMQKQIICGKNTFGDIADLIEELSRQADISKQETNAIRWSVVGTVGGQVEGMPTQTINYLQRLRELVENEQELLRIKKHL